jgi:hypothetical protein
MLQYSPKIVTDSLVMCLDASNNKSYPTDLPVKNGLVMWMDAADDTTFSYSSGTVVSQWRDKSGLNNHTSQATVLNQPSRSTAQNSRKIVTFDGTNDSLSTSNSLDLSVTHTIFAIASQTTGTEDAGLVSINNSLNNGLTLHNGSTYYGYYGDGSKYATSAITTSTSYIFTKVFKGTSSTTRQVYLNGTSATTTGVIANSDASGVIRLGQQSTYLNGTIAEVIIFNRELTATELKQVHTYLGQKWGISNTDRSIVDLAGNNTLLFGTGNVLYMPYFDFYNKGALKFDGSNDFAGVASTTTYGTNTTWEAWVNRSVSANDYNMFMGAYLPYFGLKADGTVIFSNTINSVQQTFYSTGFTSSNDTWYYLSFTTDYNGTNTTARIYINGVLNNSATFTGAQTASNEYFGIGDGRGTSSWYPFNGKVSNVKVYNRTLSATEISQNYETQKSKFANTIVQQGLVLNLDAGNPYSYAGAGTTWYDVSGNGYNSILTDGPTYSTTNGGIINLDGSNAYAISTVASIPASSTVGIWIKSSNYDIKIPLSINGDSYGSGPNIFFYTSKITWNTGDGAGNPFTNSSYPDSNWHYIVVTNDSATNAKLYIDGVLIGTAAYRSTASTTSNNFWIGRFHGNNDYTINASIGQTQLYNRVLSATEVLQNYNATKGRFGL